MYFRKLLSVMVGVVLAFGALSGPAEPVPVAADQVDTVQAMVDGLLVANPGAQKISDSTVRLANGVEATASAAGPPCPSLSICIFKEENLDGRGWQLRKCGFVNIGLAGWGDQIRSYDNNQTDGTVSIFMNWNGSNWEELSRSTAWDRRDVVVGPVQSTDGLWVC